MEKPTKPKVPNRKKMKVKVFTKGKKQSEPEQAVIKQLISQYEQIETTKLTKFTDLPLSFKTVKGLKESNYIKLTEIQKASIPLALQGKDVLGAAQTGSGKTLAFLIPILEKLYCEQWSRVDGVGALVITPTRELAYQIFETLRRIGKYQDFSAGLIIGGKDLKFERTRMDQCNIVICTPGRLLQHMDENPLFDCVTMKILVLDEADRCLDMGFKQTMNAIIANLPQTRQTLLFSATQTKSVQDLARLSLKDPSYVSVNEMTTPKELEQSYVVCELQDKLTIIWSFIKNHLKKKSIIFFSTCKQVKYFYEVFCKLKPGLSLMPLYGTLHQIRRMSIYEDFCRKKSAVLFATDLAARGLDFPEVHWVVQADCPEDVETYIHRVGRTARYYKGGESLLMLTPSELKMLDYLKEKKIPIEKIEINASKLDNPIRKIELFLAKDPALKDTAQRVISHYARAIYFMKLKDVFNVQALDFDAFSKSLGLLVPPRIRFLNRMLKRQVDKVDQTRQAKDDNQKIKNEDDLSDDSGILQSDDEEAMKFLSKPDDNKTMFKSFFSTDLDDDVLEIKRKNHLDVEKPVDIVAFHLEEGHRLASDHMTKANAVKLMLGKKIIPNKKIVFDDEGSAVEHFVQDNIKNETIVSELTRGSENSSSFDMAKAKLDLTEKDSTDRKLFKEKINSKHKEKKRKEKAKKKKDDEEEVDDFGESDASEGPDLSWMPDPDEIYGPKSDSDNEPMEFNHKQSEPENIGKSGKKMNKRKQVSLDLKPRKKKKQNLDELNIDLDIKDTEELALMLLKSKQ